MPRGRPAKNTQTTYKRKSRKDNFSVYIYRVLKEVHPELGISRKAMAALNALLLDSFDSICTEGGKLARYTKTKTVGHRQIKAAVQLLFPGELASHAVQEGNKAVTKFSHWLTMSWVIEFNKMQIYKFWYLTSFGNLIISNLLN